jgi:Outer membrane protein beta-barrel domain
MKKAIYISAFIMVFQITLSAQKTKVGFSGGIGGGIALTNIKTDNATIEENSNTGFTMGIIWDIPFEKSFSFQPSINYIRKGNHKDLPTGHESRLTINYFETLFNFLYHIGEKGNLFIGAGPSAALAINGKETLTKSGNEEVKTVKFGNSEIDDLQKFDFGATVLAGYKFTKIISLSVSYNQGLSNLYPVKADNISTKSNYIGIKLGFLFNQ